MSLRKLLFWAFAPLNYAPIQSLWLHNDASFSTSIQVDRLVNSASLFTCLPVYLSSGLTAHDKEHILE
jgi:hypothetical protein